MANRESLIVDLEGIANLRNVSTNQILKEAKLFDAKKFINKYPDLFDKKVGGSGLIRRFGVRTTDKEKAFESFKGSIRDLTNLNNLSKTSTYSKKQVEYRQAYLTKQQKVKSEKRIKISQRKKTGNKLKSLKWFKSGSEVDLYNGRFERLIGGLSNAWDLRQFAIQPHAVQTLDFFIVASVYQESNDIEPKRMSRKKATIIDYKTYQEYSFSISSGYTMEKSLLTLYNENLVNLIDYLARRPSVIYVIDEITVRIFREGYV